MKKSKKYFQIDINKESRIADINIYGEITSWRWLENDVSAYSFTKELEGLDVDKINVYINSTGGEVGEALAIYSTLKRHSAKVNTFCDGFACSAASIIFCAGDIRTMGQIAMLMIHNCMSYVGYANSNQLRKRADDNDKINQSSIEAYKSVSNLSDEDIKKLMDAETWLTAKECLDYGFATEIADDDSDDDDIIQSVQPLIRQALLCSRENKSDEILTGIHEIKQMLTPKPTPQPTNDLKKSCMNFFNNIK